MDGRRLGVSILRRDRSADAGTSGRADRKLSNPARFQENIGETFWLTGRVNLCPFPLFSQACKGTNHGKALVIAVADETMILSRGNYIFYKITLDSGGTGYVESGEFEDYATTIDPILSARRKVEAEAAAALAREKDERATLSRKIEAEAAAAIASAKGTFVLVITVTSGVAIDRRPFVTSCTESSGGAVLTRKVDLPSGGMAI
jgi:hypothetical protein